MITLLVDAVSFDAREVRVEGDAYRHLFRARRVAAGEEMRIVDGRGRARWGRVERVDRTSAVVTLGDPAADREPAFRLELLVPTCRLERASWLVEKATELGVFAIRFLNSSRAPRELGGGSLDRLRRVAVAAVEQCHRSRLPEISGPHAWNELGRLTGGAGRRWFLDPKATDEGSFNVGEGLVPSRAGASPAPTFPSEDSGALLIGPEGGLAPEERRELLAAGWLAVGLGARVLRLETAALAGAALILLSPSGNQEPKLTPPRSSG